MLDEDKLPALVPFKWQATFYFKHSKDCSFAWLDLRYVTHFVI